MTRKASHPTLKFDRYWGKLTDGDIFTTIRRRDRGNEEYYLRDQGKVFRVEVKEPYATHPRHIGNAQLLQVLSAHPATLTEEFLNHDTDGDETMMTRVRSMEQVMVLLFKWTTRPEKKETLVIDTVEKKQ